MPLVTTKEMLLRARDQGYAVGAFNVENMEMAQAVVEAAEECASPVILQTTPSTLRYAPPQVFSGMVRALAEGTKIPVALHLDHGDSFALAARCVRGGYTSVMIDGSQRPLEENIALTRRVLEMAGPNGLTVEAELGRVGGKEDSLRSAGDELTDPQTAARFAQETGVDSLAVAIGTAHGVYAVPPKLDLARLSAIRGGTDLPLVLHGASGLTEEEIRECVGRGICKVNFATELRQAYTAAVRQTLLEEGAAFDPKGYGKAARKAVSRRAAERIAVCGSAGKA